MSRGVMWQLRYVQGDHSIHCPNWDTWRIKRAQTVDTQDLWSSWDNSLFWPWDFSVQLFPLPLILQVPQAPESYLSKLQHIITPTTCPPAPPSTVFLCNPPSPGTPSFSHSHIQPISKSWPFWLQSISASVSSPKSLMWISRAFKVHSPGWPLQVCRFLLLSHSLCSKHLTSLQGPEQS